MPSKKKTKPVAKVRHLNRLDDSQGWGTLDDSNAVDYGPDCWEPDEEFQRTGVFSRNGAIEPIRSLFTNGSFSLSSSHDISVWNQPHMSSTNELCVLVFIVPNRLEFVAARECEYLWKTQPRLRPGSVVVPIKNVDELLLTSQLRSTLGYRVLVQQYVNCLEGARINEEFVSYLRQGMGSFDWKGPLQAWVTLSHNGVKWSDYQNVQQWFPPPSFRVQCLNSDVPFNTTSLCQALETGIQLFFNWELSDHSADLDILIEVAGNDVVLFIDLKPCTVMDPFSTSTPKPLRDGAVSNALLHLVNVQAKDTLLNVSCGLIDVGSEIPQSFPQVYAMLADSRIDTVAESLHVAGSWAVKRSVEGSLCAMDRLPYRENCFEVVIAFVHLVEEMHEYDKSRILSQRVREIARVSRRGIGRVVLLTLDPNFMKPICDKGYWASSNQIATCFGNFSCTLFVLQRNQCSCPRQDRATEMTSRRYTSTASKFRRPSRYTNVHHEKSSEGDSMDWNPTS